MNESQRYFFKCFWALSIIFCCFHIFFLYKQLISIYSCYIWLLWIITNFKCFFYFIFFHILLPSISIFVLKLTKFNLILLFFSLSKNQNIFLVNIKYSIFNGYFKILSINNLLSYAWKNREILRVNEYDMKLCYYKRNGFLFWIALWFILWAIYIAYDIQIILNHYFEYSFFFLCNWVYSSVKFEFCKAKF